MAIELLMPQFDPEGRPGTLIEWLVAVGEEVAAGQGLARVECDKTVLELESFLAGRLLEVYVMPGQAAAPHTLLGVVGEPGEDLSPWRERAALERASAPPPRRANGGPGGRR